MLSIVRRSIHAIGRRFGQKQHVIERFSQIANRLHAAAQVSSHDEVAPSTSIGAVIIPVSRQGDVNSAVYNPGPRYMIPQDERGMWRVINRSCSLAGSRVGILCHDGSYKFYEWDVESGGYVPMPPPAGC